MFTSLVARHSPLLGTDVLFRFEGPAARLPFAESVALAEIQRLNGIFSPSEANSEVRRWMRGEVAEPSEDLARVLWAAEGWYLGSEGAFHPSAARLRIAWQAAEQCQRAPSPADMAALAATLELPFRSARATGDLSGLDLNGFARGYIVDRALEAAWATGLTQATMNVGGDVVHRGTPGVEFAIEDPLSSNDRAPHLVRASLSNAAMATSGRSRWRGFFVEGRWLGRVIDPRTGWPVEHCASASVIARNAMTAEALSIVASVLEPKRALEVLDSYGAEGFIVSRSGHISRSASWPS